MPSLEEVGVDVSDPVDEMFPELGLSTGHTLVGLPVHAADLYVYLEREQYVGENQVTREGGWNGQTHFFWSNRTIDLRQWQIMPLIFRARAHTHTHAKSLTPAHPLPRPYTPVPLAHARITPQCTGHFQSSSTWIWMAH